MSDSVRVICRFRPHREQLLRGAGQGSSKTRASAGPATLGGRNNVLGAGGSHNPATGYKIEYAPDGDSLSFTPSSIGGGVKGRPHQFAFDKVFDPTSTQAEAFEAIAQETVADVMKGYNGTIFAYGQTGSGKTFTMFGPKGDKKLRGVIPRAADELFSSIASNEEIEEVTIKCSFLEIYKETIRDLLQPKNTGLKVRQLPSGEVYVQGLSDEYVSSADDIMQLLAAGEKQRSVAATDMNEVSSRSHSLLIIIVNQKLKNGTVRVGKLNLADLAGSERLDRTNASGETLAEAKKINQSLSALGNVINGLTDAKRTHVPYRDSVLTFLLIDSLGGNSKTTMLVCASPEESDGVETLSTLNFAKRAKKIQNHSRVNVKLGVAELTLLVAQLRKELGIAHKTITALQKTVRTMQAGGVIPKEIVDELLKPIGDGAAGDVADDVMQLPTDADPAVSELDADLSPVPDRSATPEPELPSLQQRSPPAHTTDDGLLSVTSDGMLDMNLNDSLSGITPVDERDEEREQQLTAAQTEIEQLTSQLEAQQRDAQRREQEWQRERKRMQEEQAAALADAAAAAAAAAADAAADAAAAASADTRPRAPSATSLLNDARVNALQTKNTRLEKQMAEMKETWTAYLDLILENQKAQEKERRELIHMAHHEEPRAANADAGRGPRIVKPVRKQGFFSFLRGGNKPPPATTGLSVRNTHDDEQEMQPRSSVSSPAPKPREMQPTTAPPASSSSPAIFSSPDQRASGATSAAPLVASPPTATPGSTTGPTPTHSRASSSISLSGVSASRGTFEQAVRVGYLQKKPVGFSLTRQWRRRLFVLRADSIDYYEITLPSSADGSTVTDGSASPVGSPTAASFHDTASFVPSADLVPPSNLKQSFRGSIELDAQTMVSAATYNDMSWGLEVTTKDKHSKMCATSQADRDEWLRDLTAVVSCKKRGIDPLAPGALQQNVVDDAGFTLDPELINHANFMLSSALANLPETSPPPQAQMARTPTESNTPTTGATPAQTTA